MLAYFSRTNFENLDLGMRNQNESLLLLVMRLQKNDTAVIFGLGAQNEG